jgi:hypothetical protein
MRKWRVVLPFAQGIAAAILSLWQVHNSKVIIAMGMAWDTGAPMWPFQTPEILLRTLNMPAYLITRPIASACGLQTSLAEIPILLPCIVLLWFLVGRSIDINSVPHQWPRRRKRLLGLFIPFAILCIYVSVRVASAGVMWWSEYGEMSLTSCLILARVLEPLPWCVVASALLIRIILRNFHERQLDS